MNVEGMDTDEIMQAILVHCDRKNITIDHYLVILAARRLSSPGDERFVRQVEAINVWRHFHRIYRYDPDTDQ